MQLNLTKRVSRDANAAPDDVRSLKKALNRLGYYVPDKKTGITKIPDLGMIDAIKNFQRDHDLKTDGVMTPDGPTAKALNAQLAEKPTRALQWHCVKDDRSCDTCEAYDGTIVDTEEENTPGCFGNCRCWVMPVETIQQEAPDRIEPVYPELLLLPFFSAKIVSKIFTILKIANSKNNPNLTEHGVLRFEQREISIKEVQEAIKSAKQTGNMVEKVGKYGTPQIHYKGENGVTVIQETTGRNAGKVITLWRHGK